MLSIKVLVMLFSVCLLATNTSAVRRQCCTKHNKLQGRLPFAAVTGYSIQPVSQMCSTDAIIFHTKRGLVCTDPSFDWVMEYVNRLRNEAQKVHMNTAKAPQ